MKIKNKSILYLSAILISVSCYSRTKSLENREVDYYFAQVAEIELFELRNQKVFIDSNTISEKYLDTITNGLNEKGFKVYLDIKADVYMSFYKDYLFQQKLEYKKDLYILYFTMAGFDDMEWSIFKLKIKDWKGNERLDKALSKSDESIKKILWNYDEGYKNIEKIRIFIQNDYLIMERGNLYHSLYDLKKEYVILNEESPWHSSNGKTKEGMNKWIRLNLHDKIKSIINKKR